MPAEHDSLSLSGTHLPPHDSVNCLMRVRVREPLPLPHGTVQEDHSDHMLTVHSAGQQVLLHEQLPCHCCRFRSSSRTATGAVSSRLRLPAPTMRHLHGAVLLQHLARAHAVVVSASSQAVMAFEVFTSCSTISAQSGAQMTIDILHVIVCLLFGKTKLWKLEMVK